MHPERRAGDAQDRCLPQEDPPGGPVGQPHRLEDADLPRLLDRGDRERRGDAERDGDEDEALDHVATRPTGRESGEQTRVLALPLHHRDAGQLLSSRRRDRLGVVGLVELHVDRLVLVVRPAQDGLRYLARDERLSPVELARAEVEDARDRERAALTALERERDRVAGRDVVLLGELLADHDLAVAERRLALDRLALSL